MTMALLKAAPLLLLLLLPPGAPARDGDKARDENEIIVDGDRVLALEDDDPPLVHFSGHARGRYLGVQLINITPELRAHYGAPRDAGVLVGAVEPDSPAAKAGLSVGDVITKVDGDKVESAGEVSRAVRRKSGGETVKIEVERDKAARTLTATVAERKVREIALGDLGHRLHGRDLVLPDLNIKGPLIGRFESLEKLQEKLEKLEKRMGDLEKKVR
jgi:membrane-associated protease RseP (regulator of RpoE activity)